MNKSIKQTLILLLILFFSFVPKISAASEIKDRTNIKIDGKNVRKHYVNAITGETINKGGIAGKITLSIDGEDRIGFCIDFGMDIKTGTTETPETLKEYFGNVLSETETEQLIKKLTLYTTFGYGSQGKTTDKYILATQQLIWEAISDTGFYASDFYYNQANGEVPKLKIENFKWSIDEGKTTIDIDNELNAIQSSINEYYRTPSFCSAQNKIEIEVGSTAEFIDNNNVLSKYQIVCDDGISCETEGNKLKVQALDAASSQRITFSKKATGSESYVYRVAGKQGVITNQGTLETVSCEFGVDSFKNVQTSDTKILYIITIGMFCGVMAYIAYYTKKSLEELK